VRDSTRLRTVLAVLLLISLTLVALGNITADPVPFIVERLLSIFNLNSFSDIIYHSLEWG
jgi:hypothetical protein